MGTATNSSSELMLIHLGGVYSIVTICCNLFLILVILSKVELRGQVERFFLSMTKDDENTDVSLIPS